MTEHKDIVVHTKTCFHKDKALSVFSWGTLLPPTGQKHANWG